jgi:ribonuclease T2
LTAALAAALVFFIAAGAPLATAADRAGEFDFYVLSLSWSPSYCASTDHPDDRECGANRRGFVVHGFWPQRDRGYPEYCASTEPRRLAPSTLAAVADLLPSPGLAQYEWEKHGRCSGLGADAYFALMRRASEKVVVPPEFAAPRQDRMAAPAAIEAAIVAANPGLANAAMAVICNRDGLTSVRICLDKTLGFRSCPEVDAAACRSSSTLMRGIE